MRQLTSASLILLATFVASCGQANGEDTRARFEQSDRIVASWERISQARIDFCKAIKPAASIQPSGHAHVQPAFEKYKSAVAEAKANLSKTPAMSTGSSRELKAAFSAFVAVEESVVLKEYEAIASKLQADTLSVLDRFRVVAAMMKAENASDEPGKRLVKAALGFAKELEQFAEEQEQLRSRALLR